jgi:dCMP deaminase
VTKIGTVNVARPNGTLKSARPKLTFALQNDEEEEKMGRPSWDEYFMEIAETVAKRSTCLRRRVGAVIVRDKRILATGYNGNLTGLPHCEQIGCIREEKKIPSGKMQELCRGLHAEQNALLFAASYGANIRNATLYCTHQPCVLCAKMVIQSGLTRIVFKGEYPDKMAEELFKQAGVELCQLK